MKKRLIIIVIFMLSIIGLSYHVFFKKNETHFFYEPYATMPALLEQIEFVKLPESTEKIFAWHRFPNRNQKIDIKKIHATEFSIPMGEGFYDSLRIHQYIFNIITHNNRKVLVIHANLNHITNLVIPLLQRLPKDRIKHIHLYEDGLCGVVQNSILTDTYPARISNKNILHLKAVLENPNRYSNYEASYEDIWALSKLYPTTYHLGCENLFNRKLSLLGKEINIEFVDFRKIRQTLTQEQKKMLWTLLDFDYDGYSRLLFHKKSLFFLGAFSFDDQNLRIVLNKFANNLQKGSLINLPKNLVWLYKPHPSYSAKSDLECMKNLKKSWNFIQPQIPIETFILADLEPTYIAGYPSSANYSFPDIQTLLLLKRNNYQKILKELGIKENKFISPSKFNK